MKHCLVCETAFEDRSPTQNRIYCTPTCGKRAGRARAKVNRLEPHEREIRHKDNRLQLTLKMSTTAEVDDFLAKVGPTVTLDHLTCPADQLTYRGAVENGDLSHDDYDRVLAVRGITPETVLLDWLAAN